MPATQTSPILFFQNQLPASSNFERLRYYAEDCRFTLGNLAMGAKITAVLFLLFGVVDYLIYPELFKLFLGLRLVCASILMALIGLSKTRWAKRRYRAFASLIPITAAVFLEVMIYLSGAPESAYYAGMTLCIVGTGTIYQWSCKEAAVTSLLIIGLYLLPGLTQLGDIDSADIKMFAMNCLFMASAGALVVVGTFYHYSFRCKEFKARSDLKRDQAILVQLKNEKIEQTTATLRHTETQLFQAEKMSLLGQLSSGVIHEVANPINITNQALDVLRRRVKRNSTDEFLVEIIGDMQNGLDRVRDIISELRGFANRGAGGFERFSVHDAVTSSLRLLTKPISEMEAVVDIQVDPSLEIEAVKNQIVQVLTNILHNSVQALPDQKGEGSIEIKASKDKEGFVLLSIEDNGAGIAQTDLAHVFDPFYTTKDPGEGTGLGLSIGYRIIENHGGSIDVSSTQGKGTRFEIKIPAKPNG